MNGGVSAPPLCGLFLHRNPRAVAGLVMSVVVDSVNGAAGRPVPHVRQERAKRISPSRAYPHATTAVPLEVSGLTVFAPFDHGAPRIPSAAMIFENRIFGTAAAPATTGFLATSHERLRGASARLSTGASDQNVSHRPRPCFLGSGSEVAHNYKIAVNRPLFEWRWCAHGG